MPHIRRNKDGKIVSISAEADDLHTDFVDDASPEIAAFLGRAVDPPTDGVAEKKQQLLETDLELIRVIEDVIGVLLAKGVFRFDELPIEAQRKLTKRDNLRQSLANPIDFSLGEDDTLI